MKIGDTQIDATHLFAIISIVGSACAYLFQFGFASANGIPNDLVQLGVSQFVLTAVIALAFLWLIYGYLTLATKSIASDDRLPGAFGVMLFALIPLIFTYLTQQPCYLYSDYLDSRYFSAIIDGYSVFVILLVIAYFIFPKEIKGFITVGALEKNEVDWPQPSFQAVMLFILLIVALVPYHLGMAYASIYRPRYFLKSDDSKALVVVYGDKWFFRTVDDSKRTMWSETDLYVLSGDKANDIVLVNQRSHTKANNPQLPDVSRASAAGCSLFCSGFEE